jgi:hypothetical protein
MSSNSQRTAPPANPSTLPRLTRLDVPGASHRVSADYREYARIGKQARAEAFKK